MVKASPIEKSLPKENKALCDGPSFSAPSPIEFINPSNSPTQIRGAEAKTGRESPLYGQNTDTNTQLTRVQNIYCHISYYRQGQLRMRLFFFIYLYLLYLL
jgi:hypothetical protein